jgi:tetratricopeptide (TPR) repeat protein
VKLAHVGILVVVLSTSAACSQRAQAKPPDDFATRFQAALEAKKYARCESILREWGKQEPENPAYYVVGANYYANRAGEVVNFNTVPAGKGKYVLADPKTKKPVAEITLTGDTAKYQTAIDLLKAANTRFPQRLDIWLGLAQLYGDVERPDEQLGVLKKLAEYVQAHSQGLLGREGRPYPEPVRENLAHQFNNFAGRAFKARTPEGNQQLLAIGKLTADAFPEIVFGHNLVANYYAIVDRNYPLAIENYRKALAIAPDDSLVWCNLGESYRLAEKTAEAREAFEKVLELNNDPESVALAKKQIEALAPK